MPPDARADAASYRERPDEWLVDRSHASGDEAAFAELVRRYQQRVFRLVLSILGQEFAADAEDVTQDVMVRVHHSLRSFRGDSKFGTWIYRIAFNTALNAKARVRYRAPHVSEQALSTTASSAQGPDEQLEREQRNRAVLECVHELPDVYQSALRLHYWLGASVAEISDLLDAPENTVKSYLHRARRLLHAQLSDRGFHAR